MGPEGVRRWKAPPVLAIDDIETVIVAVGLAVQGEEVGLVLDEISHLVLH